MHEFCGYVLSRTGETGEIFQGDGRRPEETRIETLFHSIKNLMKSMKWTAEQAMVAMDISENDQILLKSKF